MNTALLAIEELLRFGLYHGLLDKFDIVQVRNELFSLLRIDPGDVDEEYFIKSYSDITEHKTATLILKKITDYFAERGYLSNNTITNRDLFEASVMGLLMPRQSEIISRFNEKYNISPREATDDFYKICHAANYIYTDRINKNIYWTVITEYGTMELTVNLSKPEKDPKDIEAAKNAPVTSYPKCLLCLENVGFSGHTAWPARQNLRVIPVILDGSQWYFQYSPYAYYNEHCIILSERHKEMEITESTFVQLLDFIRQFPHYFIGSNADLPIVGGSILSHEHFQGGRHIFPMEKSECRQFFYHPDFPGVNIGIVKWPLSVIRLSCNSSEDKLIKLAAEILNKWRLYSEGDIIAFSENTPHNTVTPIARKKDNRTELDLVLRNNRTTEEHPLGIFHPHAEWHHVKKENIGLIEVMGLAILPGRLESDIKEGRLEKEKISEIFVNVLKDCGVFKDNKEGQRRFEMFMNNIGLKPCIQENV